MTRSNVELVRLGFEAVVRGDVEQLEELFDPAVKWHGGDPTAAGACRNRKQAIEFVRRAIAAGSVGELVEVIGVGDRVVVVMRPAAGAALRANLTTFRDGRVVEMVAYESPEAALAAARA